MRATRLLLMRHGATDWSKAGGWAGSTDLPMSAAGEQEIAALAERIAEQHIDRLWVSPLARARESARIYLRHYLREAATGPSNAPIEAEVIDEWREADFGRFEGLDPDRGDPSDERIIEFRRHLAGETVDGAEPLVEVARRGRAVLDRAAALGGTTLLIGHGTIARLALCELLGAPLGSFRRFSLTTGGLITLEGEPDALRLRLG